MMKFVEKQAAAKNRLIYKLESYDLQGRRVWYFIMLNPTKERAFQNIAKQKNYDLKEYGEILASGYGPTPPEEIVQQINEKYDLDFAA